MTLLLKLEKVFRLSPEDLYLIFVAYIVLATIRLGLWLLPFHILLKLLEKASQSDFPFPTPNLQNPSLFLHKIVWSVNTATRNMPGGAKCLARALTAKFLMARYGHFPKLCIGVAKKNEENIEAHAWIEYQGHIIIGFLPDLSRYIPLPSLEGVKL